MTDTIIIIRENSGSGKTTVAKELCEKLGADCMLPPHEWYDKLIPKI